MEKHTCKLCSRRFHNGCALGGHMRSHVPSSATQQSVALKRQVLLPSSAGSSASSASTSSAEPPAAMADAPMAEEGGRGQEDVKGTSGASYKLRENPRKSSRLADPEFSFLAAADGEPSGSVVQDRESETESPVASGQRSGSKRPRRTTFGPPPSPPESGGPASSASCTTTEEDLAICLMMLSRGFWTAKSEPKEVDDEDDVQGGVSVGRLRPEKRRRRHQCGTCKKVFRSYQALGGHRASHKKSGGGCVPVAVVERTINGDAGDAAGEKVHECPFCFRVFASGQALGGHKRSHLMYSTGATITVNSQVSAPAEPCSPPSTSPATSTGAKCDRGIGLFDLNLPAPVDDDMEFSAVFHPLLTVE